MWFGKLYGNISPERSFGGFEVFWSPKENDGVFTPMRTSSERYHEDFL
jgi:hypothetical protein